MALLDIFKKGKKEVKKDKPGKGEKSASKKNDRTTYVFLVKTHLYGDENEEEVKSDILNEIKGEDPEAELVLEYSVDTEKKNAAAGNEEATYPIQLKLTARTTIAEGDLISCFSPYVIDLHISDEKGNVIYAEEDLIED